MDIDWTDEDAFEASSQGWMISKVAPDSCDKEVYILTKTHQDSPFLSDDDAAMHIVNRIVDGDELAIKAAKFLIEHGSSDAWYFGLDSAVEKMSLSECVRKRPMKESNPLSFD